MVIYKWLEFQKRALCYLAAIKNHIKLPFEDRAPAVP